MAKNLKHELRNTVFSNFREGINKHSIKKDDYSRIVVGSYGTRNDLLDKMNVFADWCKDNDIKRIDDISPDIVKRFLEDKARDGVTDNTIEAYRSAINRVGKLRGEDWHAPRVHGAISGASDRGAESVISKSDYDKILSYCRESMCGSAVCIMLEREIGVRVGDIAYGININIDLKKNIIEIPLRVRGKANKIVTRNITPQIQEILDSNAFKNRVDSEGKFRPVKDRAINKFLHDTQERLGLKYHSFHDLRRYLAQEKYDTYRNSGMDREHALGAVGEWLGHGSHRQDMVLKSYVGDAW